jgi:signal transduction histidine kinase
MDFSTAVQLTLIACTFFLVVAIGIIILVLIYQKKQLRFILEKREMENQYNEAVLKSRLEAQEATLKNISREVHDNIGQLLNTARLLVSTTQRQPVADPRMLKEAEDTLTKAVNDLRLLTKSLNSEWLEQFSFYENLETEARRITSTGQIEMKVTHNGLIDMPKERQLVLFRLVQEAFQNSLKHGKATSIAIEADQQEDSFTISITDNGIGFDANDTGKHGFGIMTMKQRVALMNGNLHLASGDQGTAVTIRIPLQHVVTVHHPLKKQLT